MPYLPIDPQDIGCSYEAVIRVNSQSGKSGSAWLIEQNHGLKLPRALQQDFSLHVQRETDTHGKEMTHNALWQLFRARYGLLPSRRWRCWITKVIASRTVSFLCRPPCVSPAKRDVCRAAATACCPPPPAG